MVLQLPTLQYHITMTYDLKSVFTFLAELNQNNDRTWFLAHKDQYEKAKDTLEVFVFSLFPALDIDPGTQKASYWFHRIYRDARFSADKTPYKPNFGAVLDQGGKKAKGLGAFFHFQPGNETLVAGGLWNPEPATLKNFRLDMEDGPRAFLQILDSPDFKKYLKFQDGYKLTRVPRGFDADHPAAELLKLKKVVAWRTFSDQEVLSPGFASEVVATVKALKPFLGYLEEASGLVESLD